MTAVNTSRCICTAHVHCITCSIACTSLSASDTSIYCAVLDTECIFAGAATSGIAARLPSKGYCIAGRIARSGKGADKDCIRIQGGS